MASRQSTVLLLMLMLLCFECSYRKGEFDYAFAIQKNLYVEKYQAGLIRNLTSQYLTDSINFRIYLGTFDDEESWIYMRCHGDSIITQHRFNQQYMLDHPGFIPDIKVYSLLALKKDKEFD